MKLKYYLVFTGMAFLCFGCNNNSTSDLTEAEAVETVTYTNSIKAIIDNNCIVCHNSPPQNGAPMSLISYELVKDAILNRPLVTKISKSEGDPALMPRGGPRLPQEKIDLIIKWQAQGLQQ